MSKQTEALRLAERLDRTGCNDWLALQAAAELRRLHAENEELRQALEQPAQQEPVDFTSLLREAEEIVQGKPTWKRFIDGTPLSNDIAVWMAVFAQDVARRTTPPAPAQEPVATDEFCEGWKAARQFYTTPPSQEQEPVAKVVAKEGAEWWQSEVERYTTPPAPAQEPDPDELTIAYMSGVHEGKKRKPWVGLTDKELDLLGAPWHFNLLVGEERKQVRAYIRSVEAKLKEKNTSAHGITKGNK
jgi:hypothetical protein